MFVDFVIKKIEALLASSVHDGFEDLELEMVIPELLKQAFHIARCENVIWLMPEVRQHLLESSGKNLKPFESYGPVDRQVMKRSYRPVGEDVLRSLVSQIKTDEEGPQKVKDPNGVHWIWPITQAKTKKTLAHLLFVNLPKSEFATVTKKLSRKLTKWSRHIGFSIQHWETRKLSFLDDLTGLYNQRYMSAVVDNEIYRSQRDQKKFSVLFMDVDYFKSVNDTRGHWVGSHLLVEIGRILRHNVRRSDYAFRYGGDEFVVLLPLTDAHGARLAAERVRAKIESTDFVIDGEQIKLTLSIGLASYPDHATSCRDIIKMADEAMYCGKNKSRNVVFVAS